LDALKAYMIMKEGKVPDELTAFFDPQPQVSYVQPLEMLSQICPNTGQLGIT